MFKQFFASSIQKKITHSALIYGLQRSGTNYLQSLFEINFPQIKFINSELRHQPDHKHFRLYNDKSKIPEEKFINEIISNDLIDFENHLNEIPDFYFVISKDPYSWYKSYLRWAKKNNWQIQNYHYIEEWNLFYDKWLEFSKQSDKIIFIRYIDLLINPEEELNKIVQKINIPKKLKISTRRKVYASKRFSKGDQNYYTSNSFLEKYTKEELTLFNTKLDAELTIEIGYQINN